MTRDTAKHSDLDEFVKPLGPPVLEREHVESFHESTKLMRAVHEIMARRIANYLNSERGKLEISRNRRQHLIGKRLPLPVPETPSAALDACLEARESVRKFTNSPLSLAELSTILGAVRVRRKGVEEARAGVDIGKRAYPSGGGLYPVETFVALTHVEGLEPAIAHYDPHTHALEILPGRLDAERWQRSLGPTTPRAPLTILACAMFERSVVKYGSRGYRFALLEAGMLTYTCELAAIALGLGTLHWGGFFDDELHDAAGFDGLSEAVVDCMFVGRRDAPSGL